MTDTRRVDRGRNHTYLLDGKKRTRILLRDNSTCVICHHADRPIDVGHLIGVASGRAAGLDDEVLFSNENLAAMCHFCSSSLSAEVVPIRFLAAALLARLDNTGATKAGQ